MVPQEGRVLSTAVLNPAMPYVPAIVLDSRGQPSFLTAERLFQSSLPLGGPGVGCLHPGSQGPPQCSGGAEGSRRHLEHILVPLAEHMMCKAIEAGGAQDEIDGHSSILVGLYPASH